MKSFKVCIKISAAFLGCIIGAGFASGQEILVYFAQYKQNGIFGIIISICIFFSLLICLNMFIFKNNIISFKQFIYKLVSTRLSKFFYLIFLVFTYITYGIMGSGFGAALEQYLGLNHYIGFFIYIAFLAGILFFDQEGLVYVNVIMTPLMIIGIFVLSIFSILNLNTVGAFSSNTGDIDISYWIISAVLYAGYNSITGIAVICELGDLIKNKIIAVFNSLISVFVFGGLIILMYIPLSVNLEKIGGLKIPMLYIASILNSQAAGIYFLVLLMAMITTGAGCGYVLCQGFKLTKKWCIILLSIFTIPFGFFDFGDMVKNLYGFFGIFGFILICVIIFKTIKKRGANTMCKNSIIMGNYEK